MFSGRALREARKRRGMSAATLASHLGITRQGVWQYEVGQTVPGGKNLFQILTVLDLDLSDLFLPDVPPSDLHCEAKTQRRDPTTPENFWSRLRDEGECRVWARLQNPGGYGQVVFLGRQRLAHRIAWTLVNGPIPPGMLVCHHCDNPPCCNPDHLFLGTHKDNSQDMWRKGRQVGSKGLLKLSVEQRAEIRAAYAAGGISQSELAAQYGVSQSLISKTVRLHDSKAATPQPVRGEVAA